MKQIGSALLFFGGGSTLLYFLGYEFVVLSWIDTWGDKTGWLIRGTMMGVGALLWFIPTFLGDDNAAEQPQSE